MSFRLYIFCGISLQRFYEHLYYSLCRVYNANATTYLSLSLWHNHFQSYIESHEFSGKRETRLGASFVPYLLMHRQNIPFHQTCVRRSGQEDERQQVLPQTSSASLITCHRISYWTLTLCMAKYELCFDINPINSSHWHAIACHDTSSTFTQIELRNYALR